MLKALPLVLIRIALLFCLHIGHYTGKRKLPAVCLVFSSLVSYEHPSFSSFEREKFNLVLLSDADYSACASTISLSDRAETLALATIC